MFLWCTYFTAVCQQKCLNGGVCTRPDVCSCPNAFEGPACELDVDECATGAHGCLGPSSRCVNMAGWYYCACSPGYQNVVMYPASVDIATTATSDLNAMESTWSSSLGTMCQGIRAMSIHYIIKSWYIKIGANGETRGYTFNGCVKFEFNDNSLIKKIMKLNNYEVPEF